MSSEFMRKTAEVLEKLAAHLDDEETRHQAELREERLKTAQVLGERIETVTGESLSADVLEKIAAADPGILDALTKLADTTPRMGDAPDEPGDVGDMRDGDTAPTNKKEMVKEAAEHADQRLLDWIMS